MTNRALTLWGAGLGALCVIVGGLFAAGTHEGAQAEGAGPPPGIEGRKSKELVPDATSLSYATGFSVADHATYKVVRVTRPWPGARTGFEYLLIQRGAPAPAGYPGAIRVTIPVRSVVALSEPELAEIAMLGETATVKGIGRVSYVYNAEIRKMAKQGKIAELGEGASIEIEPLVALGPDLVITNGYGGSDTSYAKLIEAGLPVVVDGDWAEPSPLGRAEWIKFIALFYDKERLADTLFARVASEYHRLKALAAGAERRPTVFVNAPWQGSWGMPGGRSYLARLLRDAGADYLWGATDSSGTLPLSLEAVIDRAMGADFWLNTGSYRTLAALLAADPRFAHFRAVERDAVYNDDARARDDGANDYWESGPAQPQVVLADLIRIFHPRLLPGHSLYYYRRLP